MATQYFQFEGKSKFLVKISSKSYGMKNRRQRVESVRDSEHNKDLARLVHSRSASEFLRDSENEQ